MSVQVFDDVILGCRGIVYDKSGNAICDGAMSGQIPNCPFDPEVPVERLDGEYIQMTGKYDLHVWGHIREDLSRFYWLQDPKYKKCTVLKNYSHIVRMTPPDHPDAGHAGARALTKHIEWFGYPESQQLEIHPHPKRSHATNYNVERLYVASSKPSPTTIAFMRDQWLSSVPVPRERFKYKYLYLDRSHQVQTRHVTNKDEFFGPLRDLGFYIWTGLETFEQQIHMFRDAEIIVGPHGAAFFNTIFCKPDTLVLEYCPLTRFVPVYMEQSHSLGIKNHYLFTRDCDDVYNHTLSLEKIIKEIEFRGRKIT